MNYWHMQLHPGEFKEWSPDDIKKILLNNLIGCSGDPVDTFYKIKDGDVLLIRHGGSVVALVQAIGLPYKMDNNLKDDYLWFDHALKVKALEWYKDKYISGEGWYLPKTLMPVDNEIAYNYINELYTTHIKINQMKEAIDLLKYKKQIILQGPPGTGKTRMAQLIADVLIKAEIKLSPLQYLDWYVKNYKPSKESKDKNTARLLLLNEFTTSFPVANIINLTLDEYCMGKGLKDSFCYWIERKLGVLGTFSPGQAGNDVYGVYYSPKINNYKVTESDKPATEKLAVITYALNLLLTNEDYSEVKKIFRQSLILKILNSYFPDKYFPVFSQVHLKVIARILEINITGLDDIQINKKINGLNKDRKERGLF